MTALGDPVRFVPGVGPQMARRLDRLEIRTVRDLLFHIPREYRDRSRTTPIAELKPGAEGTVLAQVAALRPLRRQRGRRDLEATLRDESGFLRAVWFQQPYLQSALSQGARYYFSGTVQVFRGLELHNPEFEPEDEADRHLHVARIVPRYALTEGVSERWVRARVRAALDRLPDLGDPVPAPWLDRLGLPPLRRALEEVHFPPRREDAEPARRRIALEEALTVQIALQFARRVERRGRSAPGFASGKPLASRFLQAMPFTRTGAQERAIASIGEDLERETPMRRLLLGDVGSGKTLVALAAAVQAAGAGAQAALLAPTSILAEQHAATATRLLGALEVPFALLTAATPAPERTRILAALASGELPIVIGTHALLEPGIRFHALGLVVVDEQHRFGVRQRVSLLEERSGLSPHLLVLSATPIPRTLALTLYGDLDVTILDEKPPGRAPVTTALLEEDGGAPLVNLLREEAASGGSAFVVYPVIEESETTELKAAAAMADTLGRIPELSKAGVALVHGRLSSEDRRRALERFRGGDARILVATTVIEVGLDIPEATLVAIEHPDRFGLAQLHQLRGRVGRSDRPGRCVLVVGKGIGQAARERLKTFQSVADGFRLAEEDLRLRGPGELLGTSQHGFPAFRAANPLYDSDLFEAAREVGSMLLERGEAEGGAVKLRSWIESHFPGAERFLGSG